MKIIIISATAPPEPLTASRINWDLADHLAKDENEVWLISPKPSRPLSVKYPKLKGIIVNNISDNFTHVRVDSFTYPKYNCLCRAYESLDFGIKSISYVNKRIKDCDLIYTSSWPLFSQLMIAILRKNKNIPLIMNIQDLYPESFLIKIKCKILSMLFAPLFFIDKLVARKSTHLTVISESQKRVYTEKRKIPESKISLIQNWQDPDEFINFSGSKEDIITKYNIRETAEKFIYMYLGNIGPVAGVETILQSFSLINNDRSFLIIAGSGSAKDKCKLLAQKLGIINIVFLDVPPELRSVVELQSVSDVLLLPINPEAAASSIPSKLIAYMFSRKPVISSAPRNSDTSDAIKTSGCGWITRTNDTNEWADFMDLALKTDKATLHKMGESGFDYAISNYSKNEGLKMLSRLIYNIKVN
jgi:glycosyltransferase involved in cell wall biosynthesis